MIIPIIYGNIRNVPNDQAVKVNQWKPPKWGT
jgi:hypothetical protein